MEEVVAVIGDIHGESKQFIELIEKIKIKYPQAGIYSVGDLIDRGPDSKGVIQACMDYNVSAIIGNHDQWIQQLVRDNQFHDFCIKPIMGGKATLESYGVMNIFSDSLQKDLLSNIPLEQRKWIKNLPAYREIDVAGNKYWLIHAGLMAPTAGKFKGDTQKDDRQLIQQIASKSVDSILWPSPNLGDQHFPDNLYKFHNAVQVFGHRPVKYPVIKDHFIAIDTGCGTCEPFALSAVILPTLEIIQVEKDFGWG